MSFQTDNIKIKFDLMKILKPKHFSRIFVSDMKKPVPKIYYDICQQ